MLDSSVTDEVNAPFEPVPAQKAAGRISSQAGLASILGGLTHEQWMAERLLQAQASGEVVKLTGRRSISSPGGDAA